MATDTAPPPPPPALAHDPSLSADYLNCMVWRYLQEAGFSSAAVHLQREWYSDPLSLPIAQYVGPHQLEKLCHHGLLYRNILRRLDEVIHSCASHIGRITDFG